MAIDASKRVCPRDGSTLEKKQETFVSLDVCPRCEGSFYERGEAETALSAGADLDVLVQNQLAMVLDRSGAACPACATGMRGVRITAHLAGSGPALKGPADFRNADGAFEIDSCPKCGGLWLDAGEADRLAQIGRESRTSLIAQRDAEDAQTRESGKRGWKIILDVLGIKSTEDRLRERT